MYPSNLSHPEARTGYCYLREPYFFRFTQFFVDRLHWYATHHCHIIMGAFRSGHVGCSDGFSLDSFKEFACINSQAAEQYNSVLQAIQYVELLSHVSPTCVQGACFLHEARQFYVFCFVFLRLEEQGARCSAAERSSACC